MNRKSGYSVDLAGTLAECEANYARLCRLLPGIRDRGGWRIGVHRQELKVDAIDQAPYTTTLALEQDSDTPGLPPHRMQVRVCHDVRVAEVIAYQGERRIRPKYDYPNAEMRHRDEQRQLNRFLGEWLSFSLQHGRNLDSGWNSVNCIQGATA